MSGRNGWRERSLFCVARIPTLFHRLIALASHRETNVERDTENNTECEPADAHGVTKRRATDENIT